MSEPDRYDRERGRWSAHMPWEQAWALAIKPVEIASTDWQAFERFVDSSAGRKRKERK